MVKTIKTTNNGLTQSLNNFNLKFLNRIKKSKKAKEASHFKRYRDEKGELVFMDQEIETYSYLTHER